MLASSTGEDATRVAAIIHGDRYSYYKGLRITRFRDEREWGAGSSISTYVLEEWGWGGKESRCPDEIRTAASSIRLVELEG